MRQAQMTRNERRYYRKKIIEQRLMGLGVLALLRSGAVDVLHRRNRRRSRRHGGCTAGSAGAVVAVL